jgi:GNAT superfamily N-acetyltransferase
MPAMELELSGPAGEPIDAAYMAATAEWIVEAGGPYMEWLYGGREAALRFVTECLASERSELWAGRVVTLREGGRVAGGYLAQSGKELAAGRRTDISALLRWDGGPSRDELRRRLAETRDLFLPVEADHCFLSKIGLLQAYRGAGHGARLLDAFIESAFKDGYDHLRLDVCSVHERARGLYESRGFVPVATRRCEPLGVSYTAMILSRQSA